MRRNLISAALAIACLLSFFSVRARAADNAELLSLAAEAVAGGESYTVMVSVAAVLINRTESEKYPQSLAAVIADAGIDVSSVTVSDRARRAALDAIAGFDPTGGALRYSKSESRTGFKHLATDGWSFY
jgi:N-acetylmuramoyl-L-alanine amidase